MAALSEEVPGDYAPDDFEALTDLPIEYAATMPADRTQVLFGFLLTTTGDRFVVCCRERFDDTLLILEPTVDKDTRPVLVVPGAATRRSRFQMLPGGA